MPVTWVLAFALLLVLAFACSIAPPAEQHAVAVRDPRHYEVLVLRFGYEWPIGVSPRQIRNWITQGLETIRTALGVKL